MLKNGRQEKNKMEDKPQFYADNIQEYFESKSPEERMADSLEQIVQLFDRQNKMLMDISNILRKKM